MLKIGDKIQYVGHTDVCSEGCRMDDYWNSMKGVIGEVFDLNEGHDTLGVVFDGEKKWVIRIHLQAPGNPSFREWLEKWKASHNGFEPQEYARDVMEKMRTECIKTLCNHCGIHGRSTPKKVPAEKDESGRWVHKFPDGRILPCDAWKLQEFT